MKIQFYLTKDVNKAGEKPIRTSISIRGTRLQKPIGYSVLPSAWDQSIDEVAVGFVNSKGQTWRHINRRIANLKSHFADYDLDLYDKPTEKDLRIQFELALNKKDPREQAQAKAEEKVEKRKRGRPRKDDTVAGLPAATPKTMEQYLDAFIRESSIVNSWSDATVRMVTSFKNHLLKFKKAKTFEYFDRDGLNAFVIYLREEGSMQENSVRKQYKNLLWFMNWALRKGYTKENTIQNYKPKFKLADKPVIFLDEDELMTVYNYKIPKNGEKVKLRDYKGNEYEKEVEEAGALEKTRDMFCFCCFTSLRYSDMAELRKSNIDGDIMHITTQKTHDSLDIDLQPQAKAILAKYKDLPGDKALPVISNQKMNQYLKWLCEFCGINKPVTETCYRNGRRETQVFPKWAKIGTHAGRRTFICYALATGVPPDVVMKWTGHSDYKSMKPYIEVATSTKSDAMKKIAARWVTDSAGTAEKEGSAEKKD